MTKMENEKILNPCHTTRNLLLRLFSAIYFIAFLSFYYQSEGKCGNVLRIFFCFNNSSEKKLLIDLFSFCSKRILYKKKSDEIFRYIFDVYKGLRNNMQIII